LVLLLALVAAVAAAASVVVFDVDRMFCCRAKLFVAQEVSVKETFRQLRELVLPLSCTSSPPMGRL